MLCCAEKLPGIFAYSKGYDWMLSPGFKIKKYLTLQERMEMKQILLVIDGDVPSRPVFQYANGLCKQVTARLCILQFLKQWQVRKTLLTTFVLKKTDHCSANHPPKILWRTNAHFAGVPESLKKLLAASSCAVPFSVDLSSDKPEDVLSGYIESHHGIILTVFDQSRGSVRTSARIKQLKATLVVPLVIVGKAKKPVQKPARLIFKMP